MIILADFGERAVQYSFLFIMMLLWTLGTNTSRGQLAEAHPFHGKQGEVPIHPTEWSDFALKAPKRFRSSLSPIARPFGGAASGFIENRGQFDQKVRFQLRTKDQVIWLTANGLVFDTLRKEYDAAATNQTKPTDTKRRPDATTYERVVYAERFANSSGGLRVEGRYPLPGVYNYFIGEDASQWRTGIKQYSEVTYRDVWPGIDVLLKIDGSRLEQEFLLRPGADPAHIRVNYDGIERITARRLEFEVTIGRPVVGYSLLQRFENHENHVTSNWREARIDTQVQVNQSEEVFQI